MDEMKNNEFETTTLVEPAPPVALNQPAAGAAAPTPEKKPNNSVKIIIPIVALVLLVAILLGVAFATGTLGGGSGKKEIAEAIAATFTQSGDALRMFGILMNIRKCLKTNRCLFLLILLF